MDRRLQIGSPATPDADQPRLLITWLLGARGVDGGLGLRYGWLFSSHRIASAGARGCRRRG
jgi:hypothetical protein